MTQEEEALFQKYNISGYSEDKQIREAEDLPDDL